MSTSSPLRTAFFGRTDEPLSVRGLEVLLGQPGVTVTSVTTGRGTATMTEDGLLHETARRAGVALLDAAAVRRAAAAPELVVSFSNPVVFSAEWIAAVRWGVLNLHPAPLPEFRGCHGIEHALLLGAEEFGATLHWCDAGLDTGPVVARSRFPIGPGDSARTLWAKVDEASVAMLGPVLARIVAAAGGGCRVPGVPQDEDRAHYFDHHSLPEELTLDLAADEVTRARQVRAYDHPRRRPCSLRVGGHVLRFRWQNAAVVLAAVEPVGGVSEGDRLRRAAASSG